MRWKRGCAHTPPPEMTLNGPLFSPSLKCQEKGNSSLSPAPTIRVNNSLPGSFLISQSGPHGPDRSRPHSEFLAPGTWGQLLCTG